MVLCLLGDEALLCFFFGFEAIVSAILDLLAVFWLQVTELLVDFGRYVSRLGVTNVNIVFADLQLIGVHCICI